MELIKKQVLHTNDKTDVAKIEKKLSKVFKKIYRKNNIKKKIKIKAIEKGFFDCGNGFGKHYHYLIEIYTD